MPPGTSRPGTSSSTGRSSGRPGARRGSGLRSRRGTRSSGRSPGPPTCSRTTTSRGMQAGSRLPGRVGRRGRRTGKGRGRDAADAAGHGVPVLRRGDRAAEPRRPERRGVRPAGAAGGPPLPVVEPRPVPRPDELARWPRWRLHHGSPLAPGGARRRGPQRRPPVGRSRLDPVVLPASALAPPRDAGSRHGEPGAPRRRRR